MIHTMEYTYGLHDGVRGKCARRRECGTPERRRYGAKSLGGMTGRIRVDRGAGSTYIHETDKKSMDERGKWTGGWYGVGREWTGGRLGSLARIKSNIS